jgi:hypothetical protein
MTEEQQQSQPEQEPTEGAEEESGDPAADTSGERADRERGGPTGGEGDTDVQDSDDDAAIPDGTT